VSERGSLPRHQPRVSLLIFMLSCRILRRFPHIRLRASLPATVALPQTRGLATPSANDLFANGTNTYYVEEMYRHWKGDPKSVHPSWDVYFSGLERGLPSAEAFQQPPTVMPAPSDGAPALHASSGAELDDHLKVLPVALLGLV
jgi:2-oxoglutarate dehydrogenase E1 component